MHTEQPPPIHLDPQIDKPFQTPEQQTAPPRILRSLGKVENACELPEVIRHNLHRYKASLASVAPRAAKENLAASCPRPVLGISLGSQNMEGPKFEACVAWIAENFPSCVLLVGDAIYHYTLNVTRGVPLEEGKGLAVEAGKAFIETYDSVVQRYRSRCDFEWMPMSRILSHPHYEGYLRFFTDLYQTSPRYRALVDDFSLTYLDRVLTRTDGAMPENWQDHERTRNARQYLFEESALFTCLCEDGTQVLLYPGSIKTFEEIAEGSVPEVPEPLQRMIFAALRLTKGGLYLGHGPSGWVGNAPDAPGQGFLTEFTEEEWQRFMRYTIRQKLRPGDILVRQGDLDRSLLMLMEGTCEVLVAADEPGRMKQVARHSKGSVFGEMSFVDGKPRSATVAAMDHCDLLVLPLKKFENMKERDPQLAVALLEDIASVLSRRYRRELETVAATTAQG